MSAEHFPPFEGIGLSLLRGYGRPSATSRCAADCGRPPEAMACPAKLLKSNYFGPAIYHVFPELNTALPEYVVPCAPV